MAFAVVAQKPGLAACMVGSVVQCHATSCVETAAWWNDVTIEVRALALTQILETLSTTVSSLNGTLLIELYEHSLRGDTAC
jgi:hypothetical protein